MLLWGCSSVGRAPEWHSGGRQFDSDQLHNKLICLFRKRWINIFSLIIVKAIFHTEQMF